MLNYARWILVTVGVLVPACSSTSGNATPSCSESQGCIYAADGAKVCHQDCSADAGSCPSGQVCTGGSACCGGDTTATECSSPAVMVCCPPSGC
jgi:hypothetical protein